MAFKATVEQQAIIDYVLHNDGLTAVNSVAGSGKTSLLVEITKQMPKDSSGMYLAYNKSIATEASRKFPKNISCSTTHSLAYRAVVMPNNFKITTFINYRDIVEPTLSDTEKFVITEIIKGFCLSSSTSVSDYFKVKNISDKYLEVTQKYLSYMENGEYPCTHDAYLKLLHLGLYYNKIEYDELDILLLDEAGDLNEVTLEIFKLLPAKKKIMVGDPHQNIYSFNHTINCFKELNKKIKIFPMSQSFRVSEHIASSIEAFCKENLDKNFKFKGVKTDSKITTHAHITRTNAALVSKMLELNALNVQYGLVRDPDHIFALPLSLCSLSPNGWIKAKEYRFLQEDVNRWGESIDLKSIYKTPLAYIKDIYSEDVAIQISINLLMSKGASKLKSCYEESKKHSFKKQAIILTTAHSAKGLEFDEVTIDEDLNTSTRKYLQKLPSIERTNELNLYYVACSRAKKKLNNATVLRNNDYPVECVFDSYNN